MSTFESGGPQPEAGGPAGSSTVAGVGGERYLSLVLQHSPTSVMVTDTQGTIRYVNPYFTKVSGYSAEEVVGRNPKILQSGKTPPEVFADLWSTVSKGRVWHGEFANRRKDGSEYLESASIAPILDSEGRITGYVGIKEDVTSRRSTEARLRETVAELERTSGLAAAMAAKAESANRAKGEFLANMSHEIRTPMNGVIGMASLLLDTDLDEEQKQYAETLRSSAESLLALLNGILDYSKIEAGRIDLESIEFDLAAVVEGVAGSLAPMVRAKGLRLELSRPPAETGIVRGDPGRIRQILNNLLGNAAKFTRQGFVRLGFEVESKTESVLNVRFSVVDSGIGIPPEKRERLFRRFSQLDASTTREYGGTGLGLAICRQLVELMGGEIGAISPAPGPDLPAQELEGAAPGSEFWFTLPLVAVAPASPEAGRTGSSTASDGSPGLRSIGEIVQDSPLVLVVEDNPVNQQVVGGILGRLGARAEVVSCGQEALHALSRTRFDLVLMDVQMPEMDGLEATRIIRDPGSPVLDHDVPVVGLSASTMKDDVEAGLAAGMDDYLPKPVDPRGLAEAVARRRRRADFPTESVAPPAAPPSDPDSRPVFDREGLVARVLGDVDLARSLGAIFREGMAEQILSFRAALDAGDAGSVRRIAHGIKGSAGNMCGHALHALARGLEAAAAAGDLEAVRQQAGLLEPTVGDLCRELDRI